MALRWSDKKFEFLRLIRAVKEFNEMKLTVPFRVLVASAFRTDWLFFFFSRSFQKIIEPLYI